MYQNNGFTRLKVAAISMKPKKWDKESNALKMEYLFRRAAAGGAQVALITEGALEGYVVMDAIRNPALGARLLEVSEPLRNGTYVRRFRALARELNICLCFGLAERIGSEVYNAAIFLDHEGKICGEHRKMQFAEGYHASWFFNRMGRMVRAFDTPNGRAGILICNDRWDARLGRALALDGARVIYIPAYGSKSQRQDSAVLALARDSGIPIVEANVGLNLIISRGEIVAKEEGIDRITFAEIEIPEVRSSKAARRVERDFLCRRPKEMEKRYRETIASLARRSRREKKI